MLPSVSGLRLSTNDPSAPYAISRWWRSVGALAAVLALGLLAGCGEEVPTEYGEQVRSNFLEQCLGESSDSEDGSEADPELRNECECMYDSIRDNLTFTEFRELDTEVRADQEGLPDSVNDLLVRCVIDA